MSRSSSEYTRNCSEATLTLPFRRAGDDRDLGLGRQVYQQLAEDVLQEAPLCASPRSPSRASPVPSTEPRRAAAGRQPL